MTREEAKEILTHNWTRVDNPNYSESELDEAFFMAIEALKAEPIRCKDCKQRRVEGNCTNYYYCDFLGSLCRDNEYCSFGERREDADTD